MRLIALTVLFVAGVANVGSSQSLPQWQVGLSTFVSEGRYGTEDTTRLVYTALSLRRQLPRGDVTLRLPWLDVRSDSTIVTYQGTVQPTRIATRAALTPVTVRSTTREQGLGDVSVAGRLFLIDDRGARPALDVTGRLDLPTGDAARGLGFGSASAEFGVDLSKSLGRYVIALAAVSYTAAGQRADLDIQNPWEYSTGVGVYVIPPVLLSVSYEQWRSVVPGSPAGRDVLAAATVAAGRSVRILASAQFPLSPQAPDFGAGAGLAVRF